MGGPPHLFPRSSVLFLTLEKLWSIKVKEMMYFHSLHPHDVWWGVVVCVLERGSSRED
jgi:hypothetical protein